MTVARSIGRPHLVGEGSTLAVLVLVGAVAVGARIELAHGLKMGELAAFDRAITSIPTGWHFRVLERALWICAVRVEFALLVALV